MGTEDVIILGAQLVDLLNEFKFDVLIHGHKHDPWLRYSHGNLDALAIFSAGSFAAIPNQSFNSSRNTFHILQIIKEEGKMACGEIKTWEFLPGVGWRRADSGDYFFPQNAGFGFRGNIQDLVNMAKDILKDGNGHFISWDDFKLECREVQYLTPDDCIRFRDLLKEQGIITNPELPKEPSMIGKVHIKAEL